MKKLLIIFTTIVVSGLTFANKFSNYKDEGKRIFNGPPFLRGSSAWADSILTSLSPEERIGQLFMVAAYTEGDAANQSFVNNLIQRYNIGGLIYFKGNPTRTASAIKRNQQLAKVPLLMGIDGEWGLSMRIDSTTIFPRQMTLGAIQNDQLVYDMGKEIARQCKLMGIHINFAPDIDVNNNPLNPVINDRSFGDDKYNVARLGLAYARGMQDGGVLACAKHFPGHGDTDTDSHTGLPLVNHSRERLDTLELIPFRTLISGGVSSVMVAHMNIPTLDNTPNLASTLSPNVVSNLLKSELGFRGLVITDALNMKGVSSYFKPGEVELKALLAGNDVLLFPEDVPKSIQLIKQAIAEGKITQEEIDRRVLKILMAKKWCGLDKTNNTDIRNLKQNLNSEYSKNLRQQCFAEAITLAKSDEVTIPIKNLEQEKIASLIIGSNTINQMQKNLSRYAKITHFNSDASISEAEFSAWATKLKSYSTIIISIHGMKRKASESWGVNKSMGNLVRFLAKDKKVILVVNGNPYSLKFFDDIPNVLITYEDNQTTSDLVSQMIFGALPVKGRLSVTASADYKYGQGFFLSSNERFRLQYGINAKAGLDVYRLEIITDSICKKAIESGAIPGCQVMVIRNNNVALQKSYGSYTYDRNTEVTNETMYDIASMSKICGTALMAMRSYDKGYLDIYKRIRDYLPTTDTTNKGGILIRDLLTHTAGLKSWIPFYKKTLMPDGSLNPEIFRFTNQAQNEFSIPVTEQLYMNKNYLDSMWYFIYDSELKGVGEYTYSDLSMIFLKEILEKSNDISIDKYLNKEFYDCLGTNLCYNPLYQYSSKQIAPTEFDITFRKQQIQGTVHDPASAMFGGVQGHAGLFGNANDVAIVMQMLQNGGTYGGKEFIKPNTIQFFNQRAIPNCRRGFCFDKPELEKNKTNPCCDAASAETFGHTGFTGTCVWVDPLYDITFIFLSNRVYPNADNKKLSSMDIRTKLQDAVYQCLQ